MPVKFSKGRHHEPIAVRLDKFAPMGAPDDCWPWIGHVDAKGYGRITVNLRTVRAHRVAYEAATGQKIPAGLHILHSCDNAGCVNPRHLKASTNLVNQHEAWERNRKRGVRKLTPQNVLEIRASTERQGILAERFGVNASEISRIKTGRRGHGILRALHHQEG
jgi:hypothetical protein